VFSFGFVTCEQIPNRLPNKIAPNEKDNIIHSIIFTGNHIGNERSRLELKKSSRKLLFIF
jgi:hypothetical protein